MGMSMQGDGKCTRKQAWEKTQNGSEAQDHQTMYPNTRCACVSPCKTAKIF
eukprot:m.372666 g.372666  ORF g.372666 m.372666 type:complete len:51 (+) comp63891_c0_seq1:32-184(+)